MAPTFVPAKVPDFPRAHGFESCDEACDSCERSYDSKIASTIDMELPLYGGVAPLTAHICCCTGQTDWQHTIEDAVGSMAQRISESLKLYSDELKDQDRVVLSNVSVDMLPKSRDYSGSEVMILSEKFCILSNVQPTRRATERLVREYALRQALPAPSQTEYSIRNLELRAVVLICSHMRRDARCGKTAPILLDEFEEQLREKDLFYDPDENESEFGRVLVTCVSHIGGHKFAGNVLIYRRRSSGEMEGIWLGRVFPHHVSYIIDKTVLQGEVPYQLLRGGVRW